VNGRALRRRARRGFTLLELLVVIAIVGMLAAVAAPALRGRGDDGEVVRKLASLYDAARGVALDRGRRVDVLLELSSGSYYVLGETSSGGDVDTVRAGRLDLPAGARLTGGRDGWARHTFDALGRARGDRLMLDDARGRHDLATDFGTGAVRARPR
jgi:prepilin-type N-terminal cleavage/methylation domain-containing protein